MNKNILFFLTTTLLLSSCGSSKPASQKNLADFFKPAATLTFVGGPHGDMFGCSHINIFDDRIYLTMNQDGKVLLYDREGTYQATFGNKGKGPGEFEFPGDVTEIGEDVYVMDAVGRKIVRFNHDAEYQENIVLPNGGEKLLRYTSKDEVFFLLEGLQLWKNTWQRVNLFTLNGEHQIGFVEDPEDWAINSWRLTADKKGRIYHANILSPDIKVYDATGKVLRTIKLGGKHIQPMEDPKADPSDAAAFRKLGQKIRKSNYTTISQIMVIQDYVLVSTIAHNPTDPSKKSHLDIFDEEGRLVAGGIVLNGHLFTHDEDSIYFSKVLEEGDQGKLVLEQFRFVPPNH